MPTPNTTLSLMPTPTPTQNHLPRLDWIPFGEPPRKSPLLNPLLSLSLLSIASCLYMFYLYAVQSKPWLRRHPNRVFVFRAKMELALAVFVIAACSIEPAALWNGCEGADLARAHYGECGATPSPAAAVLAWLGQYCLLGSELWFLVIVHDLASSVDNPFSSYKLRATQYARAVHGVAFVVATLLVTVGGGARGGLLAITHHAQYGGTVSGFVWIQYSHSLFQPATWLCFYLWLAAIYVFGVRTIYRATMRFRHGLPVSLEMRRKVLTRTRLVVIGCEPHARLVAAASRALRCRSPSPRAFTRGTHAPAQEHHLLDAVHHCEDRDDVRGGREQAVVV